MNVRYTQEDKRPLFEEIIYRHYNVRDNKNAIDALYEYVLGGDVDAFIRNGGDTVDAYTTFYFGGDFTIKRAKERLAAFIHDCRLHPEKYRITPHIERGKPEWEVEVLRKLAPQLFTLTGGFLSPKDFFDVFQWFFGDVFQTERQLELVIEEKIVNYTIFIKPNWMSCTLLGGIREYLFPMDNDVYFELSRFKNLYPYLCSTLPFLSKEAFLTELFSRRHELPNGDLSSYRVAQFGIRKMIGALNNVVSIYNIKAGFDEVVVSDRNELTKFKQQFDAVPWPEEYYNLVDFVIESGPEFPKASC